jgi:hypothetical protein
MEDGRLVGAKTEVVHGYDKAIEAEALGLKAAIEFVDWFRDCRNTTEMVSYPNFVSLDFHIFLPFCPYFF